MQLRTLFVASTLLSGLAQAQITVPTTLIGIEGNSSTAYPWNWTSPVTAQYIYDSTNFTTQGATFPILLQGLRFRANGGATCTGRTYTNVTVKLSTCPVDYLAVTNAFASNHGLDLATVYTGPVTVSPIAAGTTPNAFYVDITLPTPFLYDPNVGDLNVELVHDGANTGGTSAAMDLLSTTTTTNLGARVWHSSQANATTAQTVQNNMATPLEVVYAPAAGLHAGFAANVTTGATPLAVTFSDQSFSSDPGGITSWAWDLDGDNITDSTAQSPTFVYPTCGDFTVRLTVTDASHAPSTVVRNAYIRAGDNPVPSFTVAPLAPGVYQFTDTTTPAATAWAWDFDGDNVTDSTQQNPVWVYTQNCLGANVKLSVTRDCRGPLSTTQGFAITPNTATAAIAAGNGTSSATWVGNMFDVQVTNPQGINVCAVSVRPYTFTGPFNVAVYVTPDTYLGKQATASAWRLLGTGSGVSTGGTATGTTPTSTLTVVPFSTFGYLPAGNYGLAVYLQNPAGTVYVAYTNGPVGPFANADVTILPSPATAPGIASTGLFGGTITSRAWNGALHYSTATNGGDAGFGFFGAGCPGTLGVTHLVGNRPQLGTTLQVQLDNLPASAAILLLGFSNSVSVFGPLPVDTTPYGAPGCFGRVSTEASQLLLGAGNAATWSFTVPPAPGLLGQLLFNQALVLDPAANALGAVLSDATGMMIGN